jgi:hypothetical protein
VAWKCTEEKLSSATEKTRRIWLEERAHDAALEKGLKYYINNILPSSYKRSDEEKVLAPLPSGAACYTNGRKTGGTAAALAKLYTDYLTRTTIDANLDGATPSWAVRAGKSFTAEDTANQFQDAEVLRDIEDGIPFVPPQGVIEQIYLDSCACQMRPLALDEMGGKVRVATLHPAEEVQTARRITADWLRQLRGYVMTRDMLRGEDVVIDQQDRESKLYSADLSSATDYINHKLARYVGRLLCTKFGRLRDIPLVHKLFGPKV